MVGKLVKEKEDLMMNHGTSITTKEMEEKSEVEGETGGNCCENYSNMSTLQNHQQYFRNTLAMNEENGLENIWINMESHRNFLLTKHCKHHSLYSNGSSKELLQSGSSKVSNENLDIDDDGLIGYETADVALKQVHEEDENLVELSCSGCDEYTRDFATFDDEESHDESIELISYVNNFSLKNAFAWTLGTLLQSTSELYPKVF